jgi:hypothetical protein
MAAYNLPEPTTTNKKKAKSIGPTDGPSSVFFYIRFTSREVGTLPFFPIFAMWVSDLIFICFLDA